METHVIPWMSKEETDRLVQELKQWARARQAKEDAAKAAAAMMDAARSGEAEHRASVTMNIGSL